jgi:hypothetical protein
MARQKNFRKIPGHIKDKIATIKSSTIKVGCVARLRVADVAAGEYEHLSISIKDGKPVFPASIVPDGDAGRYSDANANGQEVVRKDLPMVTKTYSFEVPNWGDSYNGTHDVDIDRDVYQREFVPPTENEIEIELVGEEGAEEDKSLVFRFIMDQPLDKDAEDFAHDLFRLLNIMQENIGEADVFDSNASTEDYLRTKYVNWEIIPPGERDTIIARIVAGMKANDPEIQKRIAERYDFLAKMKPQAYIQGHGGFRRYFGAQFTDNLVAFENMEYGNAAYIMVADWEEASQKTKQELMTSGKNGTDFFRVVHGKAWKDRIKDIIKKHRN